MENGLLNDTSNSARDSPNTSTDPLMNTTMDKNTSMDKLNTSVETDVKPVKENTEVKQSPAKMGEKTDTKQPQRGGKGFSFEVVLLDGQHKNFQLDKNAEGRELFDKVCQDLDLQEKEYFGLQYVDERLPQHLKCWLSPDKKISKQKKRGPWLFEFALKFYPPDPTQLKESLTKWLVVLQVRRDILSGKLPATFLTQAMLGSYCVQSDVGDYDPTEHKGIDYIKDTPFSPNQTPELLEKIAELHKHHKGQTPDEAENNFLENAKKMGMYGVDLHAAQDAEHVDIMLGVCASGLQVYKEKLRINRFVWPKILKISYKRNHFYIKVRPTDNNQTENNFLFRLNSHRLAKRLWKICVEHHAFFRLREADQPQNNAMFPKLGSKFRYSGRTLFQARQKSADLDRGDPYFERSQPTRNTFAAPRTRSDEHMNRPSFYDDTNADKNRRLSERPGEDKRDEKLGDNSTLKGKGGDGAMYDEDGNLIRGPGRKTDEDRHDRKPGEGDATYEKEGYGGTAGLTPAELLKKQKEEEKERKRKEEEERKKKEDEERKRKKDEEKRQKEEEKRRKEEEKMKGKGKAEDRRDEKGGNDATDRKPGYRPGAYGDEEGADMFAPLGKAPGLKDGDRDGKGRDGWDEDGKGQNGWDKDGKGRDGEFGLGKQGEDRQRLAPGEEGYDSDQERWAPGFGRDRDADALRKGLDRDKNDQKDKKDLKGFDKDNDRDKKKDGKDDKKGPGLFGLFKKPPDAKSHPDVGAYPGGRPGDKGSAYPGYRIPGLGVGAGDMTGVMGDEKWIDNKMGFIPVEAPIKETKSSLKGGDGIDHTMPFFSPAATSTVNRHGKIPPPVPRKAVNSFGDDSFSRTDMYKTEKDGIQETRVEHKVVLSSADDDFDFDTALIQAIQSVTEFNPDMSVERIECVQQIEDVRRK